MLTLKRRKLLNYTSGHLTLPDGKTIFTLERPWLDNTPFISCIPDGVYKVNRDKTGRHQWFSLEDVPGRTFIEIHPANTIDQLEGCIAPCMRLVNGVAHDSKEACELLLEWFKDDSWVLEIR